MNTEILDNPKIAWAAGFWEGEGYCRAEKGRRGLEVHVVQCSVEPLEKLQEWFGGSIREDNYSKNPNASRKWVWSIGGERGRWFLKVILPYVVAPRRQQQIINSLSVPLSNRAWSDHRQKLKDIYNAKVKPSEIAKEFGVSRKTVYNIKEGYLGKKSKDELAS